jgi:hypothetical protein
LTQTDVMPAAAKARRAPRAPADRLAIARSAPHMRRSSLPAVCSGPQAALGSLRAVGRHEDPYGLAQKSPVFP